MSCCIAAPAGAPEWLPTCCTRTATRDCRISKATCRPGWRTAARSPTEPSGQRLVEIADQVVDVLEADRHPQQALRRAAVRSFRRRPVLDQAFDAAEAGRAREYLHARRGGHGAFLAALDFGRQHPAEPAAHLPQRDVVARVV